MPNNIIRKLDNKIYKHYNSNDIKAIANIAGILVQLEVRG